MAKKKKDSIKNEEKDLTKINLSKVKSSFSSKAFFEKLGKAIVSVANSDFGSAIADIMDFPKDKTVEEKAFHLIISALFEACRTILQDEDKHQEMLDAIPDLALKASTLNTDIRKKLNDLELSIDASFLSTPHKASFVKNVQELYQKWLLEQINFTVAQSKSLAELLPFKFLDQLGIIWSNNSGYYKEVESYFKNPFFKAIKTNSLKTKYYSQLQSFYSEPIFNSPEMTLADIYIEPNFEVYQGCYADSKLNRFIMFEDGFLNPNYREGSLHHYILNLYDGKNSLDLKAEESNFIILLGQPGQGKTSFCIRMINDLLTQDQLNNRNLYFIRLRRMNVKDIINHPFSAIRKYISETYFKSDNFISLTDFDHSILILDGLDELYMNHSLTNSDVENLIRNLSNDLLNSIGIKILLTTRYNYLNIEKLRGDRHLILKLGELNLKQQLEWLKKYKSIYSNSSLTKEIVKEIHENDKDKFKEIKELISQPILLQMIAQSEINLSVEANRAAIYQTLFDNVIGRKWSKHGQLERLSNFKEKDLRHFLQDIALTIFHSKFDYVRRSDFYSNKLLQNTRDHFLKSTGNKLALDDMMKDILVSFYFKNKEKARSDIERDDDQFNKYAIEFLHKSLQEYLTAEKIWRFFKYTFLRKDRDDLYFINDWKDCLKIIHPILSPKILSSEITDYLIEVINNDKNQNSKEELVNRLAHFLPKLIKRDFLAEYHLESSSINPINLGLSTFYAYWTVISNLRENNTVELNSRPRFIFLIKALINLLSNARINLKGADLEGADFRGANLANANLRSTNLRSANLVGTNLGGADLMFSELSEANVESSELIRAKLANADLVNANLRGANLESADLRGANLRITKLANADLVNANLRGANLGGANLGGANLGGANLGSANLGSANLINAYLGVANLEHANLEHANLSNVHMGYANLNHANLESANLIHTNLESANLIYANLNRANLKSANLESANLKSANLESANLKSANLKSANLNNADMKGAYLEDANLEIDQLLSVETLQGCRGLMKKIEIILREKKPSLFE